MQDILAVVGGQIATHFAGNAGDERARGDDHAFGNDGARRDDGTLADFGVVQDNGADADEADVLNHAAMDGGVVADRDPVADDHRILVAHAVEHGAVLHIGVSADPDRMHIATHDGVHPDAGMLAQGDVADDLRGGVDVARGWDDRRMPLIRTDHDLSLALTPSWDSAEVWTRYTHIKSDESARRGPQARTGWLVHGGSARESPAI